MTKEKNYLSISREGKGIFYFIIKLGNNYKKFSVSKELLEQQAFPFPIDLTDLSDLYAKELLMVRIRLLVNSPYLKRKMQ